MEVFIDITPQSGEQRFSDIRLLVDISRDLNIGIGDEFDFTHHNELCEENIKPKYILTVDGYSTSGKLMSGHFTWSKIMYDTTLVITNRIFKANKTIELKGKLV